MPFQTIFYTNEHASCAGIPVRCEQARKGRDKINTSGGGNLFCKRVDIFGRRNHQHGVSQPFDSTAGDGDWI